MKTILLILLNLQLIYGTTFNNTSSVYGRDRSVPTSEYRLGYTMPYGNGFNRNSTFGYPQNTYVNHKSTFGYTTGQPRRVIIKHGNDSIDTGRDDDWNHGWRYYHGSVLGIGYDERWYYRNGDDMYFWNGHDWEHTGRWDWIHTHTPSTASPSVLVGDPPFFVILGLLFLWMTYDIFIKPMIKKDNK